MYKYDSECAKKYASDRQGMTTVLKSFLGFFSCTDMTFKDMIDVTVGKKIFQFTLTEVNKHHSGQIASNKHWYYQTVIALAAEIK